MQFQVQTLVNLEKTSQDQDQLDLFVGLKSPLNDPFNIFLRVKDIESNDIYFYAYSLGKKKVVIWGLFDRNTNEFLIDEVCKYSPNDLKSMIDTWQNHKFKFFFSSVRNRISSRVMQNVLFDSRANRLKLLKTFKELYMQELINNGIISGRKLEIDIQEYSSILDKVANAGLEGIKSKSFDSKVYEPSLELIFSQLEADDIDTIKRSVYSGNMSGLTPYQSNVTKHILVHLFLLIFSDMDEYRVAKYIESLNSKKSKELKRFLKGEFMYEWLIELSKVLRVYKVDEFINSISQDILRLVEEKINRSDVGVIGGEAIPINLSETVNNMSKIFEEFIEKSEYSKISVVNNLKICPSLKDCVGDETGCGLFYHGDIRSKHDLT